MFMLNICLLLILTFNVAIRGNDTEEDVVVGDTENKVNLNQEHQDQAHDDK